MDWRTSKPRHPTLYTRNVPPCSVDVVDARWTPPTSHHPPGPTDDRPPLLSDMAVRHHGSTGRHTTLARAGVPWESVVPVHGATRSTHPTSATTETRTTSNPPSRLCLRASWQPPRLTAHFTRRGHPPLVPDRDRVLDQDIGLEMTRRSEPAWRRRSTVQKSRSPLGRCLSPRREGVNRRFTTSAP